METDPVPCLETSDDQGPSSHVRSYDCIFCKRGFTNAQALGGHMNLHRKDRAKLKQPLLFDDNKLHATSNKKSPLYSPISPNDKKSHELESTGGDRSTTAIKFPWIISREDHGEVDQNHGGEVRQLSLFVETPLSAEDRKLGCSCSEHEGMKMQPSHGSELLDLDLELRLGHEPCDTSKVGTIEFF